MCVWFVVSQKQVEELNKLMAEPDTEFEQYKNKPVDDEKRG